MAAKILLLMRPMTVLCTGEQTNDYDYGWVAILVVLVTTVACGMWDKLVTKIH